MYHHLIDLFCFGPLCHIWLIYCHFSIHRFYASSMRLFMLSNLSVTSILHFSKALWWKDLFNHSRDVCGCKLDRLHNLMVIGLGLSLTELMYSYCAHQTTEIFIRNFSINLLIFFLIKRSLKFSYKCLESL